MPKLPKMSKMPKIMEIYRFKMIFGTGELAHSWPPGFRWIRYFEILLINT
jgi:hypothetical protein